MNESRRTFLKNSLPTFFGALGGGLFVYKNASHAERAGGGKEAAAIENDNVPNLCPVEAMELRIGENLIPLVDKGQGGDLVERIKQVRRRMALDLGILLPPIRIRDNPRLSKNDYMVLIRGANVGSSKVYSDRLLALSLSKDHRLEGIEVEDPSFKIPSVWIRVHDRKKAESAGYKVFDANTILATHLSQIVKYHAADLLTLQNTVRILDHLTESEPALVRRVNTEFRTDEIHKVLKMLLRESVSIRDMTTILETLLGKAGHQRDPLHLAESVRTALACQITEALQGEHTRHVGAVYLDSPLEDLLRKHVVWEFDEAHFDLPNRDLEMVISRIRILLEASGSPPPPVVTAPIIRPAVFTVSNHWTTEPENELAVNGVLR